MGIIHILKQGSVTVLCISYCTAGVGNYQHAVGLRSYTTADSAISYLGHAYMASTTPLFEKTNKHYISASECGLSARRPKE